MERSYAIKPHHYSIMWQERQAEFLRDEIEALIVPLSDVAGLYDRLREPLSKDRRGLATGIGHDYPWALIPMIVCEAISGHYEQAVPVAAALQLFIAAAEVLDDIEDADSSESLSARCGPAVAINVATTLLILAEKAITRLRGRGVNDDTIIRIMDAINSYYTTACAGQHLDLSLTPEVASSEAMYLRVASMKSASQTACACHTGALLATPDRSLIDTFSGFGHNLGMASQITNDIQGVTQGSDILKRKMTLPAIYALAQTDGETHHQLELAFNKPSASTLDNAQIKDLIFGSGGVHYATVRMEFYKQQALDILSAVEGEGISVERLRLFLE